MAAIAQTIAVVDKSNKVVSTSKQLKNVFIEAKTAYLERKAEIKAERKEKEERELHKAIRAMSVAEETESRASSRSQSRRHHRTHSDRPRDHNRRPSLQDHRHASARSIESGHSSRSSLTEAPRSRDSSHSHTAIGQFNDDLAHARSAPATPTSLRSPPMELARRRTDLALTTTGAPRLPARSYSSHDLAEIDMDLAYGEFHPELHGPLVLPRETEQKLQQQELSSLVTKCKMLLDEANCAQHSVKAIVLHLQKNPDAMAAVALTLAEISNIASKMAPGALTALKAGAPTVFAILAAPEFLIAVGVGVGLTVVAFGGYKIIKKIKARAGDKDDGMDEALDVGELDRIEHWRRGIADADAAETASVISTATSVEGEYITPMAARSMGHISQSESRKEKKKRNKDEKKEKKHRKKTKDTEAGTDVTKGSRRSSKSESTEKFSVGQRAGALRDLAMVKVKKPSPLRAMFRSGETNSTAS